MRFITKQILKSIIAFAVMLNLIFFLPRLVPGSAANVLAAGYGGVPQQVVQSLNERLGLGKPIWDQYQIFLSGVFTHWPPDFGFSYAFYPSSVTYLISIRFPFTLLLIFASFILSSLLSFVLAVVSAMRRGSSFEFGSMYASIIFWATPPFWLGLLLAWIFGVELGWLPILGTQAFNPGTGLAYYSSVIVHLILPVITLTAATFGFQFLIIRSAAQQVLESDYVIAARARGLRNSVVAMGYIVRNSMLPLTSLLGYTISFMVSTAVFVEFVFNYNGVGDLLVDGILNRDYPILEGGLFYITLLVIILSLVGDFLLLRLDPRLRR
ncbi:MAG: ABC transporter permease [Nitrososphaerales archaeon]